MDEANNSFSLTSRRKRKGISLTPLIDVVFILLLFFMLTSSFKKWQTLDMPVAAESKQLLSTDSEQDKTQFLQLYDSGKIATWPQHQQWSSADQIQQQDIQHFENSAQQPVLVIPEYQTELQLMVKTLEHLESLGLNVKLSPPVERH